MITKRQLGIFIIIVGAIAAAGTIAADWVGAGEWAGFGPMQRIGLGAGLIALVIGLSLYRLGDRPA